MLAALFISLTLGHFFIARLQQHQIGQVIRPDGPESHFSKAGTPTMGGIMILKSVTLAHQDESLGRFDVAVIWQ